MTQELYTDTDRLNFITEFGSSWNVQYEKRGTKPVRYRMIDDGESWGQWHSTARSAIDAAMMANGVTSKQVEQGRKVPEFVVREAERAIHSATHPTGMQTNGPAMARIEASKLALLLRHATSNQGGECNHAFAPEVVNTGDVTERCSLCRKFKDEN